MAPYQIQFEVHDLLLTVNLLSGHDELPTPLNGLRVVAPLRLVIQSFYRAKRSGARYC